MKRQLAIDDEKGGQVPSKRVPVLVFLDLEDHWKEQFIRRFPQVRFEFATEKGDVTERIADAEILFTKAFPPEAMKRAGRLRWVQAGSAGVDRLLRDGLADTGVILTNASGAHGIPMAELILSMMFSFATRLHDLVYAQPKREWIKLRVRRTKFELDGQKLCVVGLGDIGGTLARKAKALGMHVAGVRRTPAPFAGIDEILLPDQLMEILPEIDHLALCLPLTSATRRIIGEKELRAMKPSAFLYNVGRGASVDQDALLAALVEGRLAGAGLDVTDPEPLPPDSPLWDMPQVILTQHTSGSSPFNSERLVEIFSDNLKRFLQGKPLNNVVSLDHGY